MEDLISIIVPVYKAEKFLKRCVDSIRNQTYKNLEIILVDDGTPDNSGNLCDEYAKEDNRIVVIHKENGGLSDARNYGIARATGKYIGFVDSDDYIKEDMYEILYKEITKYNADISSISNAMVRENGEKINGTDTKEEYIYNGIEVLQQLLLHQTLKNYAWDKLYKAELIKEKKFIKGICYEDVPFAYEVMAEANRVVYYDSIEYYYVKHKASISATCTEKNVKDYISGVINRYIDINEKYDNLNIYNYYAIANTAIHAYYKVILSDAPVNNYKKELDFLREKVIYVYENLEKEVTSLFSVYQKACFYMLLNDEELFLNFLKDRQRKNKSNSAS